MVRYRGLDTAGHYFLRYADPRSFGDVTAEEQRAFGQVLPSAYAIVDAMIGRALASLGPDDLLLVVSGFGMEPLGVGKRLLERALGNGQMSGTHEHGPDGFLLAYGGAVEPGRRSRRSWTWCPRCCTSSGFPWRTTWTATPGRTSSGSRSRDRSRSFRVMNGEAPRACYTCAVL